MQQSRNAHTEIHMTSSPTATRSLNRDTSLQTPQTLHTALIVVGVVICFALLSFYAHLVQSQVERGETRRAAQRAGLSVVPDSGLLRPDRAPSVQSGPLLASASPR
jgi:hypothetical protein